MRRYLATAEYKEPLPWSDAKGFEYTIEERDEATADKIAIVRAQLVMREIMDFKSLSVTEHTPSGLIRIVHFWFEQPIKGLGGKL